MGISLPVEVNQLWSQ